MSIRPDLPLAKYARAQALQRHAEVARNMRRVRREPEAEAVHDLRVSIRRFSSVLQVFPGCFCRKRVAAARKRLQRVLRAAGEVRDRDIALELSAQADPAQCSRESLESDRGKAARRLRRLVGKKRRRRALSAAKRAVRLRRASRRLASKGWSPASPANENAVERLPALFRRLFEQGRRALEEPVKPAKLHALRLKVKRRRYTLELFAPCYGPELVERLDQLKTLQDLLGEVNDCRASKDLAADDEMRLYLDQELQRRLVVLESFWRESLDAPGECEGWMLELARRSANAAGAGC